MAQGGNHGGGENNSNKKAKRSAVANAPAVLHQYPSPTRAPGGSHIVGDIPAPNEFTKRPVRR